MKVKRLKETFKPIVITIETEEEAEKLWHILNYGDGMNLIEYQNENGFRKGELTSFKYSLFQKLNKEFKREND